MAVVRAAAAMARRGRTAPAAVSVARVYACVASRRSQPRCMTSVRAGEDGFMGREEEKEEEERTEDVEERLRSRRGKRTPPKLGRMKTATASPLVVDEEDGEDMTLKERLWKGWVGEKGVLKMMNDFATKGLIAMVIAWICIRFIGPGLGLYTVVDPFADLPPPPVTIR